MSYIPFFFYSFRWNIKVGYYEQKTYTGDGWASGIVMDETARFVIVSNRKHDSVSCFSIDSKTGMLKFTDCIKTEGEQPRYIVVKKDTNTIIVANELTDTLREISIDHSSEKLNLWTP